ncbi:hypothetical protein [Bacillus cereus]|uniref:hypothetical protein n=1 Tax=Bacillus cereus TaxID=1396 RepID=UPI00283A9B33|nr:hypothetical protein [Bacillus cereus]
MNEIAQNLEAVENIENIGEFLKIIGPYQDKHNYEYEKMALNFMTEGDYAYDVDSYFTPSYYYNTIYPEKNAITIDTLSY